MKKEINAIKLSLARFIYKKMYSDNYETMDNERLVISENINSTNKRALEMKLMDKNEMEQHSTVIVETPVRKNDSKINKRALKIQLIDAEPLAKHSN